MAFNYRWQSDLTETEDVKISHAVTNFEVILISLSYTQRVFNALLPLA